MSNELTFGRAKELYSFALNARHNKDTVYAARLFEELARSEDTFYVPLALSGLAVCYAELDRRDLLDNVFKRVTQLSKEQQILLRPAWLALCYQKVGDLQGAAMVQAEVLKLAPKDSAALAAMAELSVLGGELDPADHFATELQSFAEPKYQILGRMIRAFVLALRAKPQEALAEFSWVARYLISSGTVPAGKWDYRDLQPLVAKTGPNARLANTLIDVLNGNLGLPEFIAIWSEMEATTSS